MEMNYGPALGSWNEDDYNMKRRMVEDMFAGVGLIPQPFRYSSGDELTEGFVLLGEAAPIQIDDKS